MNLIGNSNACMDRSEIMFPCIKKENSDVSMSTGERVICEVSLRDGWPSGL